jgi:hypothetical protein
VQQVLEAPFVVRGNFSSMNIFGECFNLPNGVFDFRPDLRGRRKRRIPQPVVTDPFYSPWDWQLLRLQFSHGGKRMLDLWPHFLEQIVRKFHPADVERKTEFTIFQEISLKPLPQ